MVALVDYRAAEAVLTKSNHDKGYGYKLLGLRDGLVISSGPKWRARRRMIEPFFNTKNLTNYLPIMNRSFTSMIKEMTDNKVKSTDMASYIHRKSLDIIMDSTMSIPIDQINQYKEELINDLEKVEKIVLIRILNPFLYIDWMFHLSEVGKFFKTATGRLDNLMRSKIDERLNSKSKLKVESTDKESDCRRRKDCIDLLLNYYEADSKNITSINMEGIMEEILNLVIAGHDTIASGLRWTLFLLGNHLDCQDKLYEEISTNLTGDVNDFGLDLINTLTYLDHCIKESLRLYPPVPFTTRHLDEEAVCGEYFIPKRTNVLFSYYHIHRDPKVWTEPDKFDPDRFNEERFASIPKYAYIPFGSGTRSCIGKRFAVLEIKLFIIHLMRKFRFISTQPVDKVTFTLEVTIKPTIPLTIKIFPRL